MNYLQYMDYLEKTYEVTLPSLYKQLTKDDMLDMQTGVPNWYQDVFPKLVQNPPFLLVSYEYELYSPDEMIACTKDHLPSQDDGDWFYLKPEYENRLVMFAQCGNGDCYAFYYEHDKHSEPQIVRICHDCESEFVAKNLQEFMVYKMLEVALVGQDSPNIKEYLLAQLRTHSPYLTPVQIERLNDVYQKEPVKNNHGDWVLLNNDEFDTLVDELIPFDKRDETFELYEYE
ncbi:SMI1 / KNR4 family [Moraxella lacunata]|uniref:SMI1 / KNR4 family n=1 Tax=Moraxella lacunata TaxID=477 RepID=A0A1V4GQC5_MORLA|nr:SMI1/KNR4 family protein [Moraxella lacunata]OPH34326.1 SMI1/KNR4 family protein [Moraxella lacunata]STZ00840.1 SMI1 / KNR4 family [Moraxella lacunata]